MNNPDRYVIVKINSGIVSVLEDDNAYTFVGFSGSEYQCVKGTYGYSTYTYGVLESMINATNSVGYTMTIMEPNFDVLSLNN